MIAAPTGGAWPPVSVIVPVKDGATALDGCLTALDAQDYPGPVQVVVVDNGSTEDVGAVAAAHPAARLLREARPGSYAARNTGLTAATGEVLAFTDADCQPEPSWLREAVTCLRAEPPAAMVGGRVELTYAGGRPVTGSELHEHAHGFRQDRYLTDQRFAVTANMVTWRATMDRTGAFDATLLSRGDAQWGQRVAAWGGVQRYAPDAVVRHPARATLGESVTKWRRVARGKVTHDLAAGRGPRHFAGSIAHQLRTWAGAVTGRDEGPTTLVARARYLGAYSLCRLVTIAVQFDGMTASLATTAGPIPPRAASGTTRGGTP